MLDIACVHEGGGIWYIFGVYVVDSAPLAAQKVLTLLHSDW